MSLCQVWRETPERSAAACPVVANEQSAYRYNRNALVKQVKLHALPPRYGSGYEYARRSLIGGHPEYASKKMNN